MHDDELRFISDINTKKEIAWKKLYRNYYPALCNYASRIIQDEVIVEDIVDTGFTMQRLLETLGTRNPEAIHIASLLVKPDKLKVDLNIEYVAMEIPNDFIVGYGLDYDGFGRNYPDIYTVVD